MAGFKRVGVVSARPGMFQRPPRALILRIVNDDPWAFRVLHRMTPAIQPTVKDVFASEEGEDVGQEGFGKGGGFERGVHGRVVSGSGFIVKVQQLGEIDELGTRRASSITRRMFDGGNR